MRYKIQDANKIFKIAVGPLCLLDAKNLFPHGGFFLHAGSIASPFVHGREHAGIFGSKPSLYFAEHYLSFNNFDFRGAFGHHFHGFGLNLVKVHFHKKDNHIGFLYNLHNSFDRNCPCGANGLGFVRGNDLRAEICRMPKITAAG